MFAFLFASIGVRIVRRTWLYALLAIASYQLGASSVVRTKASPVRGAQTQASRVPLSLSLAPQWTTRLFVFCALVLWPDAWAG